MVQGTAINNSQTGTEPEILSTRAPHGKFLPFLDEHLSLHLGLGEHNSLQYFNARLGSWLTLLRNSPPLSITSDCAIHFKYKDVHVPLAEIIDKGKGKRETPGRSNIIDLAEEKTFLVKTELVKMEDWDTISLPSSPSPERRHLPFSLVGDRPSKLAGFPTKFAIDMHERLQWIEANSSAGNLEQRFSHVFNRKFVSSTFHRHMLCWRWNMKNNNLKGVKSEELWKDYVSRFEREQGKKPCSLEEVIDLTDTDECEPI